MNAKSTKGRRFPPEPLTMEECGRLADAALPNPRRPSSVGLRNRALIVLLYATGARISEALGIVPSDLSAEGRFGFSDLQV